MLRFFCLLTGDRVAALELHGPVSRKKVVAMGMGLLIVTAYWLLTGFTIARELFHTSVLSASAIGLVCAGLVFGIDRSIVLVTSNSRGLNAARIALALVIALIGGAALDLVLLRGEVEQELVMVHQDAAHIAKANAGSSYASHVAKAELAVEDARKALEMAEERFLLEMNGSAKGSGLYGMGKVAKEKKSLADQRLRELKGAQIVLADIRVEQASSVKTAVDALVKAQAAPTLFARIHAMHRYILRDKTVLVFWSLITLFLIGVELIPVLAKHAFGETAYDLEMSTVNTIQRQRTETVARIQTDLYERRQRMSEVEREALLSLARITSEHHRIH